MKLVQALQQPRQRGDKQLMRLFESEVAQTVEQLRGEQNMFVRKDGVISDAIVEG